MITSPSNVECTNDLMNSSRGTGTPPWLHHVVPTMAARASPRPSASSRCFSIIVGVLDRQTYQGGTRGSKLCGGDRDRETKNSKVCARTRDTRFIQVRAAKAANPTSCLRDQVWRPALGVGLSPEG
jgi:hypothetical protein